VAACVTDDISVSLLRYFNVYRTSFNGCSTMSTEFGILAPLDDVNALTDVSALQYGSVFFNKNYGWQLTTSAEHEGHAPPSDVTKFSLVQCCRLYFNSLHSELCNHANLLLLQEDWGELYTGKRAPGIFILDLQSFTVQRLEGTPEESSVGQPVWSPSGTCC